MTDGGAGPADRPVEDQPVADRPVEDQPGADGPVAHVARALARHPGARARVPAGDPPPRRAAVALVLRSAPGAGPAAALGDLELLLVQRAEYPGDPWSGHVALPGGRAEPGDASSWHTAARETWEETGLELRAHARQLGTLDELYPRTPVLPPVVVRPHVAALPAAVAAAPLALSAEVAAAFWVPLRHFGAPGVDAERVVTARGAELRVASYGVHGRTVWGMTERILRQFLARTGAAGGAGPPVP